MSAYLAKYADRPVPRYTSYPPANHFGPLDSSQTANWFKGWPKDSALSLYLHIPFCRTLCWYCGCHTHIVKKREPVASYVDLLLCEIDTVAGRIDQKPPVKHIHFGGGTPNTLLADELERIMAKLRQHFAIADDAEIAMEIDPRVLTQGFAQTLAKTGFNRVSLGVQDVSQDVQEKINRVQSNALVEKAIGWLKAAGLDQINVDLLYGLPGQTLEHIIRSADCAVKWDVDRVAVFGYAHVPWFKKHQQVIDTSELASPPERFDQAQMMAQRLTKNGMVAVGLDHFAKPDDPLAKAQAGNQLKRNFQGYTNDNAPIMIGFGPSAVSQLPAGYLQNEPHLGRYRTTVDAGDLAIVRGFALSADDRFCAAIIAEIMCGSHVDLASACARHGQSFDRLSGAIDQLNELIDDGLAMLDGTVLKVTGKGQLYVRCIAACFDQYFVPSTGQHSRAI